MRVQHDFALQRDLGQLNAARVCVYGVPASRAELPVEPCVAPARRRRLAMPNPFGGRQLIADLATVDTNGAWLLDDEFAELCSEVLGQPLTARDCWRAWFTPAGGTYPDDCEFTLLRSRVGD